MQYWMVRLIRDPKESFWKDRADRPFQCEYYWSEGSPVWQLVAGKFFTKKSDAIEVMETDFRFPDRDKFEYSLDIYEVPCLESL